MRNNKPSIGVSACLLGREVRYDGGHKRSRYLTEQLGTRFELVEFCPEVAIGLPVPRAPIRLYQLPGQPGLRAVKVGDAGSDYTERLAGYADAVAAQVRDLSGFIVKQGSPSCGLAQVKVYAGALGSAAEDAPPVPEGIGIFTARLRQLHPWLPVAEEGCLEDPQLRRRFVSRVLALHRQQTRHG